MPPLVDAEADCLTAEAEQDAWEASNAHWNLPYFGLCRNTSCVRERYSSHANARRFMPVSVGARREADRMPALEDLRTLQHVPIEDIACGTVDDEQQHAVRTMFNASKPRRTPLVLRGCALAMPAVRLWLDDAYLLHRTASPKAADDAPFWALIKKPSANGMLSGEDSTRPLADGLLDDVRWDSLFGAALRDNFSSTVPHVWASEGGKRAALHWDAVDNLHVMVSGEKEAILVAPRDHAHFYMDFPEEGTEDDKGGAAAAAASSSTAASTNQHQVLMSKAAGRRRRRCPTDSGHRFGCDDFGCFGYAPVNVNRIDLARFPRVAEATVHGSVRLEAGDALFIPPFWAHHLVHLPLEGGGRNIALSFVRRPLGLRREQRPFVADLAETQRRWEAEHQDILAEERDRERALSAEERCAADE